MGTRPPVVELVAGLAERIGRPERVREAYVGHRAWASSRVPAHGLDVAP